MTSRTDDDAAFARRMQRKRGVRFCNVCGIHAGERIDPIPEHVQVVVSRVARVWNQADGPPFLRDWKLLGGLCPVHAAEELLAAVDPCTAEWARASAKSARCCQNTGLRVQWCESCRKGVDRGILMATTRRSGKTLSALADAVSKAESGKYVTYVVHAIPHTNYCIGLLREHGLVPQRKAMMDGMFKFNSGGTLRFLVHSALDRRLSRMPPEENDRRAVIYDHHALDIRAASDFAKGE